MATDRSINPRASSECCSIKRYDGQGGIGWQKAQDRLLIK